MEFRTVRFVKDVSYKNCFCKVHIYSTMHPENNVVDSILIEIYDGMNIVYKKEFISRFDVKDRYTNAVKDAMREYFNRTESESVNNLYNWDGTVKELVKKKIEEDEKGRPIYKYVEE